MKKIFTFLAIMLASFSLQGQDFVHLGRYAEANASMPAKKGRRVVFMGDSITEVWANINPGGFFDGDSRVGRGISGEVTAQMLLRFRADVINIGADVVVILAGTNDIALNAGAYDEDYTFSNIVSMVELARANGIKPVIASVIPAASFPWRPEVKDAPAKIVSLNARLRAYAASHRIIYADYHSAMLHTDGISLNPGFGSDGVHPNADGCLAMETALRRVLKRL